MAADELLRLATDLLRLFAGVSILAFASWTDWRWRRAPNVLWLVLGGIGLVALGIDLVADPALREATPYLVAVPVFVVAMYVFWYFGLIAGGADAKALMAIGVLLPWPVALGALPLLPSFMPGAVSVLGNSLIAALLVPIGLFVVNATRGDWRFPYAFLGYRMPVDALGSRPAWPMQRVEDGEVVTRVFASRRGDVPMEDVRRELREAGLERVWVTPKVPFMLPLLAGFVLAFTVGDLLLAGVEAVVGGR